MKTLLNKIIEKLFGKKFPKTSEYFRPYVEEDTECDKCYKKKECIEKGYLVNSTFSQDTREHYIKGRGCVCVKGCEEFLEMKLSEILKIADTEDMKIESHYYVKCRRCEIKVWYPMKPVNKEQRCPVCGSKRLSCFYKKNGVKEKLWKRG